MSLRRDDEENFPSVVIFHGAHSLRFFLLDLFINKSRPYQAFKENTERLIQFFHHVKNGVAKLNSGWDDKNLGNEILIRVARETDVLYLASVMKAVLALDWINDINATDEKGITALGHLMMRSADQALIAELQKRGATLSQADEEALKRIAFEKKLSDAITNNEVEKIHQCLAEFKSDFTLLHRQQFETCLQQAARGGNLIIAKSLVDFAVEFNVFGITGNIYPMVDDLLKRFAHRIGVGGSIRVYHSLHSVDFDLAGEYYKNSVATLLHTLNHSSIQSDLLNQIKESLLYWLVVMKLPKETRGPLLFMRHEQGKTLLLPINWNDFSTPKEGDHVLGLGILYDEKTNKTYISISNRGFEGLAPCLIYESDKPLLDTETGHFGTVLYSLDGKLDVSFFSSLCSDALLSPTLFNEILCFELRDAKTMVILPAMSQGYPTCSYVNLKRCIEGLQLATAVCEGKPLDEKTFDEVYDQYKAFSIDDKQQAVRELVAYYQKLNPDNLHHHLEIISFNEFILRVILLHHSAKNNEAELIVAKELYAALPEDLKKQVATVVPSVAKPTATSLQSQAFFSRTKSAPRNIQIYGDWRSILKYQSFLNFLEENGVTGNYIRKIIIAPDQIKIYMRNGTRTNEILRDEIFKKILNADIKNLPGEHAFVVTNPEKLSCMLVERVPGLGSI
jgi:hypothetical protein